MSEATRLIGALCEGDPQAASALLPLIYDELRRLARSHMARERSDHTLQATALVHEAYLRLVHGKAFDQRWDGRRHFFAAAAEAMRRILVEHARRRGSAKRGGGRDERLDRDEIPAIASQFRDSDELLSLDESLTRLAKESPELAELVKLCSFGGLSLEEAAEALGISRATAYRRWAFARAWLHDSINGKS